MLNQVVMVGRLKETPTIKENENGKKVANITLSVPRNFKNVNGEYDTDFIPCILWNGIAESACEYCKEGDLVGVKGRLQMFPTTNDDGFVNGSEVAVIAEKVSFLSNKKVDE